MPIANVNDAVEVRAKLADLLNVASTDRRVDAARTLFMETLDWQYANGLSLFTAPAEITCLRTPASLRVEKARARSISH